jgi:hypothetical protein
MRNESELLSVFQQVRPAGSGWLARCPAHQDQRPSLSIGRGADGRWLLKCQAGCAFRSVVAAAGLEMRDLFPSTNGHEHNNGPQIVSQYPYLDESRTLLYTVLRFHPKNFRQRAADGTWSLKGVRRVLYGLPELHGHKTIYVVEGEKDADTLAALGLAATTSPGGAGKWRTEYADQLKASGCQTVVILPDNDPPGAAHARDVARSCVDAGMSVKLIPLPELNAKGDASDWLKAGHTKDELLTIVEEAPFWYAGSSVTSEAKIVLTSLADLLAEPVPRTEYLVADRIPRGSVVLLAGTPKTGKSRTARELAFCVASGQPFLGWRTAFGAVWYFAFEDKKPEMKASFEGLGATGLEPLHTFIDQAPIDLIPKLHRMAAAEKPALIIIDTLAKVLRAKNFNDYAEITERFDPLLNLSRESGATLLLLHHASAHSLREGLDAILGSTAVAASVDNALILKRTGNQRILSSVQRIGPDLDPTIVALNSATGRLELAGSKRAFDDRELGDRLLEALRASPEPLSEHDLQGLTEGRKKDQVRVLRRLLGMGLVGRSGLGKRKNPYRYEALVSGSRDSSATSFSKNTREPAEPEIQAQNPGLNFDPEFLVPEVPYISREPERSERKNGTYVSEVPTYVQTSENFEKLVPEIPATSGKSGFETHTPYVSASKQSADSGSQNSEDPDDDIF